MSTYDKAGRSDASPRGGAPGFVYIQDEHTLLLPDSKGNNRVDSLVNIVETGKIGLLFFIPGVDETLRINGSAEVNTDHELLEHFSTLKNPPISCLKINVEESFLHCANSTDGQKVVLKLRFGSNAERTIRDEEQGGNAGGDEGEVRAGFVGLALVRCDPAGVVMFCWWFG